MKVKSEHDCQSFRGLAVIKYAALLLLGCHISWVNAEETLPDPTVSTTAKLRAKLITPEPTKNESSSEEIQDPTSMNENFRAALNRINKNASPAGASANSPAMATPSFPEIKLLAAACEHHPEKNHAMLRINGKSEMVGVGDKMTALVSNRLVEIEVLDIQKNHVRLRLQPNNETLILR